MVKFKKPKKIKEDNILPIDNSEALSDKLNKSEEFVKKSKFNFYNFWYFDCFNFSFFHF